MTTVKSLLQSRKFWLTVLGLCSAVGAYLHHDIAAPQLADIIAASVSVLVLAISHEDNGAKGATQVIAGGPTTVNATVPPPADDTIPVIVPSITPKANQ